MLRVWLQDLERVSPAERRGDLWLVRLSPLAVSLEALLAGNINLATVAMLAGDTHFGGPRALPTAASRQPSGTTSAPSYHGECRCHEKRGSHDSLCSARVYRRDRRRLLRRLRQSSGRRPVHSSRGSGFGEVTRPCRGAWPNDSRSGVGISSGTEKRGTQYRLYAARLYRRDRRRLLRRLRQSSGRSPVHSSRGSGFAVVTLLCGRAWPNGSPSRVGNLP